MRYEFIESPLFEKFIYDYLTDDEYAELQGHLIENPDAGALIKGSGGVRKLRWARSGVGKSSGMRVCYYVKDSDGVIWLLVIYPKSVRDSIEGHVLKQIAQELGVK